MTEKIIGILGGMGPEATIDLFYKIIKFTPAKKDQDHLRIIIDNNPKIPDRTAAILGKGEDPIPALRETAKNLEKAGADFIIIPCNNYWLYRDSSDLKRGGYLSPTNRLNPNFSQSNYPESEVMIYRER